MNTERRTTSGSGSICAIQIQQKRHICNFRKYRPISFKFAIQLRTWKQ